MLRGVGLLDSELFNHLAGRHLTVAKQLDNRNPGGIRESLKDLTLELAKGVAHLFWRAQRTLLACAPTYSIFEILNIYKLPSTTSGPSSQNEHLLKWVEKVADANDVARVEDRTFMNVNF